MEVIIKYAVDIIFGLISTCLLWSCRNLFAKDKKLKELQEEEKNRQYRQMILDEIEPIINELTHLKNELNTLTLQGKTKLDDLLHEAADVKAQMYADLEKTHQETLDALDLIINSYKFRLIQLCKTHLRDDYISESDFERITEMYKLYHGLGGNGQAQEYYEKVLRLEIKKDK